MTSERYRSTRSHLDVGFVFGALGASAVPGTVLLRLLGLLGTSESAARNVVTQMRRRGTLQVVRVGRHAQYRLAPAVLAGYRHVEGTASPVPWTGRFHALLYDVPERSRSYRDRLRFLTGFAGYGLLRPGVLICPEDRMSGVHVQLGPPPERCRLHEVQLDPGTLDRARAMTAEAWDLEALATDYRAAEQRLSQLEDSDLDDLGVGLRRLNVIYHSVLGVVLRDPRLPVELWPAGWPRPSFADSLDQVNRRLGPVLQPRLRRLAVDADPGDLLELYPSPWSGRPDESAG